MAYFCIRNPIVALLLYGVTASYADGYGAAQWLGASPFFEPLMEILFVLLFVRAICRILLGRGSVPSLQGKAVASLIVVAWCMLSVIVKGGGPVAALTLLPYLALPYLLVWIAFGTYNSSKRALIGLVSFQSTTAVLVLFIPQLEFLRGDIYNLAGTDLVRPGETVFSLPDASTLKGFAGNHYAQFHNPNVLGFYAVVAIGIGLCLAFGVRRRGLGLLLVVLGTFLWMNSLTRGPMIGLLVMMLVVWLFAPKLRSMSPNKVLFRFAGFATILVGFTAMFSAGILDFLIPESTNISVTARADGFSEAWSIIGSNPIFGHNPAVDGDMLSIPHLLPLLFASQYGLVAGIGVLYLVFIVGGAIVFRVVTNDYASFQNRLFVAVLYGATAGIAMTNNFAAPMLFAAALGHLYVSGANVATVESDMS